MSEEIGRHGAPHRSDEDSEPDVEAHRARNRHGAPHRSDDDDPDVEAHRIKAF
jgi:hypothetical protein